MELSLDRLTKQYGRKIAVDCVSATLKPGVYGLLGANGAGKTTLMRMLCAILESTSGEVLLDGKEVTSMGADYRNVLGYLPQDFGYYPNYTAMEFLMYIAALKGIPKNVAKKRATELLEVVDLSLVANKKVKTFSGGMKQRVGIAQALLNNPKILILDEPTAGLDPKERVRFRNLLSEYAGDKIVILSTQSENITYSDKGKLYENSFLQYKIPSRMDIGHINVEFESSYENAGPFGAKSIGEVVINTPLPAITDALSHAAGKRFYELPITPDQIAMARQK